MDKLKDAFRIARNEFFKYLHEHRIKLEDLILAKVNDKIIKFGDIEGLHFVLTSDPETGEAGLIARNKRYKHYIRVEVLSVPFRAKIEVVIDLDGTGKGFFITDEIAMHIYEYDNDYIFNHIIYTLFQCVFIHNQEHLQNLTINLNENN